MHISPARITNPGERSQPQFERRPCLRGDHRLLLGNHCAQGQSAGPWKVLAETDDSGGVAINATRAGKSIKGVGGQVGIDSRIWQGTSRQDAPTSGLQRLFSSRQPMVFRKDGTDQFVSLHRGREVKFSSGCK